MELLRNMPHQGIGLDRVLSDSVQHCVDLSPIKNYNFGWGPNFVESPSSLVRMLYDLQRNIACCSDGTPLREMPHQNFGLDKIPSDSGQHCVNLSPIKNYNFG